MFLLLPSELIKAIGSEIDSIQDVKSLRLTCKASNEILAAQVLYSITINITKPTLDKDIDKLQCLATRPCTTSYATHELTIKSLSPEYVPNNRRPIVGYHILDGKPQPSPKTLWAEDKMKRFLFDALSSFQNVQKVSWQPILQDTTWVQITVMDALRTLTKINNLHVEIDWCRLQVPFHLFADLQEISIVGSNQEHHKGTLENLARMVSQSTQLNSITIRSEFEFWTGKGLSLHQLFRYYPRDLPPLRLRRLVLNACQFRLDDITIPHLKYLTSLSLTNLNIKYRSNSVPLQYSDGVNYDSGGIQEIWSVLIKADIWLEEITIDDIFPALLEYLASYSGLRILNMTSRSHLPDQKYSDHLATQFYAKPLANHVQSLRKLDIRAIHEGLWCVDNHNLPLIHQCVNLKHLGLSIISSQADLDPVIKRIIDMVATRMPQIDTLNIRPAGSENERLPNFSMPEVLSYACTKIVASIDTYLAPPSCGRLPLLSAGGNQFRQCQSMANDGRLRYCLSSPNGKPIRTLRPYLVNT